MIHTPCQSSIEYISKASNVHLENGYYYIFKKGGLKESLKNVMVDSKIVEFAKLFTLTLVFDLN